MKCLIYCTKEKPYLCEYSDEFGKEFNTSYCDFLYDTEHDGGKILNGKIVAEFDSSVEKMGLDSPLGLEFVEYFNKESQLYLNELIKYVGNNYYYAIHIHNLKIFDKPKELKEFDLKKAPQNMSYCTDEDGNIYCLISIKSKWVEKILNKEKTIEVRKRVLKGMVD